MSAPSEIELLEGVHRYQCIQKLNSGTFGFVKLAIDLNTGRTGDMRTNSVFDRVFVCSLPPPLDHLIT